MPLIFLGLQHHFLFLILTTSFKKMDRETKPTRLIIWKLIIYPIPPFIMILEDFYVFNKLTYTPHRLGTNLNDVFVLVRMIAAVHHLAIVHTVRYGCGDNARHGARVLPRSYRVLSMRAARAEPDSF